MSNSSRSSLSLGQKILITGASPEVVVHALDEGLLTQDSMNAYCEGLPLVASWISNQGKFSHSLASSAHRAGVEVSMEWPVSQVPVSEQDWLPSTASHQGLWLEHALIRLVRSGLDPTQDWKPTTPGPASLLQWASMTNRPWLLNECLHVLSSDRQGVESQRLQLVTEEGEDGEEWVRLPVIHASLRAGHLEVAQIWQQYGARLDVVDEKGESAIFSVSTAASLRWVLALGARLDETCSDGAVPVQVWPRQTDATTMSALRDVAQEHLAFEGVDTHQHSLGLITTALDEWDLPALKDLWKRVDAKVVLPNGMTPLGYLSKKTLSVWSNRTRDHHKIARASKMLAFLWHRTDPETASGCVSDGHSDLEVASLVARLLEGQVSRSMGLARVKHFFALPTADRTLALSDVLFKPLELPRTPTRGLLETSNTVLWQRQRVARLAAELLIEDVKGSRGTGFSEAQVVQTLDSLHPFIVKGRAEGHGLICASEVLHLQRLALAAARDGRLCDEGCSLWYGSCLRSIAAYGYSVEDSSPQPDPVEYSDLLAEVPSACADNHGNVDSNGHVHAMCVLAAGWGDRGTILVGDEELSALMAQRLSSVPAIRGLMPLILQSHLDVSLHAARGPSTRGPRM